MINSIPKVRCSRCGCEVNPIDHDVRCEVPLAPLSERDRALAWVGDAVHRVDVRLVAQLLAVPHSNGDQFCSAYVTNEAMREYMRILEPGIRGSKERLGTLFESKYQGAFREEYLRVVFPTVAEKVLCAWTPPGLEVSLV